MRRANGRSLARCRTRWVLQSLLVVAAFGLTILLPSLAVKADAPKDRVERALSKARRAITQSFSADIEVLETPLAEVANVGRRSRTTSIRLEGMARPSARQLEMRLWAGGGSVMLPDSAVAMRVEGDQAWVQEKGQDWVEAEGLAGTFAPQGDLLSFLDAATDVASLGEASFSGTTYQRYSYRVDGPEMGRIVRDALQDSMRRRGELPSTLEMAVPTQYAEMTGFGELWIDRDGRPLRNSVELAFPDAGDLAVSAKVVVSFERYAGGDAVAQISQLLQGLPSRMASFSLLAMLLGMAMVLAPHRRSQRLYAAVVLAVIGSMVGTPLIQAAEIYRFADRSADQRREREASEKGSEIEQRIREELLGSAAAQTGPQLAPEAMAAMVDEPEIELSPAQMAKLQRDLRHGESWLDSPVLQDSWDRPLAAVDSGETPDALDGIDQGSTGAEPAPDPDNYDGVDTDGDGLTDRQEAVLPTNPTLADSDGDGLSDYVELVGYIDPAISPLDPSRRKYTDPTRLDSNEDGLPDGMEWMMGSTLTELDYQTYCLPGPVTAPCAPDPNQQPQDTDGDGVADLLDDDNDGDGVPDRLDAAPYAAFPAGATPNSGGTFTDGAPFKFDIANATPDSYLYYDFQLRPRNADRLWYAFTVLDWPRDEEGQVQDTSGRTIFDACIASALAGDSRVPTPEEIIGCGSDTAFPEAGDMRVVPMAELRIFGSPTNLPVTATNSSVAVAPTAGTGLEGRVELRQEGADLRVTLALDPAPAAGVTVALRNRGCTAAPQASVSIPAGQTEALIPATALRGFGDGLHKLTVAETGGGSACGALPEMFFDGDRMIDTALLQGYGAFLRRLDENGELAAYVPLLLETDDKTGERSAFSGRMVYQASGSWGREHEMRLVWMVQILQGDQQSFLHTYRDGGWYMTGFNVREDRGFDSALVWEDLGPASGGGLVAAGAGNWLDRARQRLLGPGSEAPAAPAAPAQSGGACPTKPISDPRPEGDTSWRYELDDDATDFSVLRQLTLGLDSAFLNGRDSNGDGDPDLTIDKLKLRFDHRLNCRYDVNEDGLINATDVVTTGLFWTMSNTLRVETKHYRSVDEGMADLISNVTQKTLADAFTPHWSSAEPITPTLLFAQEMRSRQMGLSFAPSALGAQPTGSGVPADVYTTGSQGRALRIDFGSGAGAQALSTDRFVKWVPYRYDGMRWADYEVGAYMDEFDRGYLALADESDLVPSLGTPFFTRVLYSAMAAGVGGSIDTLKDPRLERPIDVPVELLASAVPLAGGGAGPPPASDGAWQPTESSGTSGSLSLGQAGADVSVQGGLRSVVSADGDAHLEIFSKTTCERIPTLLGTVEPRLVFTPTVDSSTATGDPARVDLQVSATIPGEDLIDLTANDQIMVLRQGDGPVLACSGIGTPALADALAAQAQYELRAILDSDETISGLIGFEQKLLVSVNKFLFKKTKRYSLQRSSAASYKSWKARSFLENTKELFKGLKNLNGPPAAGVAAAERSAGKDLFDNYETAGFNGALDDGRVLVFVGDDLSFETQYVSSGGGPVDLLPDGSVKLLDLEDPTGSRQQQLDADGLGFELQGNGRLGLSIDMSDTWAGAIDKGKWGVTPGKIFLVLGIGLGLASLSLEIYNQAADGGVDGKTRDAINGLAAAAAAVTIVQSAVDVVREISTISKIYRTVKALQGGTQAAVGSAKAAVRTATTASKATKVLGVIGVVVESVVAIGFFIFAVVKGGLKAFGTAFNALLAQTIAAIIVAVILFAISLIPVVGQIIAAIVAIIDAIVLLITFLVTGTATSASAEIAKFIAAIIFGFTLMVEIQEPKEGERARYGPVPKLVAGQNGYQDGSKIQFSGTYTDSIKHKGPGTDAWMANLYLYLWTRSNLKSTTIERTLEPDGANTATAPDYDEMTSLWKVKDSFTYGGKQMYEATATQTELSPQITLETGINSSVVLKEVFGYALPAIECWLVPVPFPFPPFCCIPVPTCYSRDVQDTNKDDAEALDPYYFDVFPPDLDSFYRLDWDGRPAGEGFRAPADYDGDGLISAQQGGLDPDDSLGSWDSDGDGLSDRFEIEARQRGLAFNARSMDTDGDLLDDRAEAFFGSWPSRSDTDNDRLTDKDEADGWPFIFDPVTRTVASGQLVPMPALSTMAFSDPVANDTDGDGIDDRAEKTLGFPFHPLVRDPSPLEVKGGIDRERQAIGPDQSANFLASLIFNLDRQIFAAGGVTATIPTELNLSAGSRSESGAFRLLPRDPYTVAFPITTTAGVAVDTAYTRTIDVNLEAFLHDNDFNPIRSWETRIDPARRRPQMGNGPYAPVVGAAEVAVATAPDAWGSRYVVATLEGTQVKVNEVGTDGDLWQGLTIDEGAPAPTQLDIDCREDACLAVWNRAGVIRGAAIRRSGGGITTVSGYPTNLSPNTPSSAAPSVAGMRGDGSAGSFMVGWTETHAPVPPGLDPGSQLRARQLGGPAASIGFQGSPTLRLDMLDGTNGEVLAMAGDANGLVIGGSFTEIYSDGRVIPANHVARWDTALKTWTQLGGGLSDRVTALAIRSGTIVAAGDFAQRVAKISPPGQTSWSAPAKAKYQISATGPARSCEVSVAVTAVSGEIGALAFGTDGRVALAGRDITFDQAGGSCTPTSGGDITLAAGTSAAADLLEWRLDDAGDMPLRFLGGSDGHAANSVSATSRVLALTYDSAGALYAGGDFSAAGGVNAARIAKFSSSAWTALGSGVSDTVYALDSSGTTVYVGGAFSTAGGSAASRFARWTASAWSTGLGGLNATVRALRVSGADVFVGGDFTIAGGLSTPRIARFDGASWSGVGSGFGASVRSLALAAGSLHAGGDTRAFHPSSAYLARFDGSDWTPLCTGSVVSTCASRSQYPSSSRTPGALDLSAYDTDFIALWQHQDGTNAELWASYVQSGVTVPNLAPIASGLSLSPAPQWDLNPEQPAHALAVYRSNATSVVGQPVLIEPTSLMTATGNVQLLGSSPGIAQPLVAFDKTERIAEDRNFVSAWRQGTGIAYTALDQLGGLLDAALTESNALPSGALVDAALACLDAPETRTSVGHINAVAVRDAPTAIGYDIYVGGAFTTVADWNSRNIARWNSITGWTSLGDGLDGEVLGMALRDTGAGIELYVVGDFDQAGGVNNVNGVAMWDGSDWHKLGSGLSGGLGYAVAVDGAYVYVGGTFSGPSAWLARWDGANWNGLAGAMRPDGPVYGISAGSGGQVYFGGSHASVEGIPLTLLGVGRWNGSAWADLGSVIEGATGAEAASGFLYGEDGWTVSGSPASFGATLRTSHVRPAVVEYPLTTESLLGSPFLQAPSKFEGVKDAAYGGALRFAMLAEGAPICQQPGDVDALILEGGGRRLRFVWDAAFRPNYSDEMGQGGEGLLDWTQYEIRLVENASSGGGALHSRDGLAFSLPSGTSLGWQRCVNPTCSNRTAATRADLRAALADIDSLALRARFKKDSDPSSSCSTGQMDDEVHLRDIRLDASAVRALDVIDDGGDRVFAAGNFERIGSVLANSTASWAAGTWSPLGNGLDNNGRALAINVTQGLPGDEPDVYVGGDFETLGGRIVNGMARFNGLRWFDVKRGVLQTDRIPGGDTPRIVRALASADIGSVIEASTGAKPDSRSVVAGGDFNQAGGEPVIDVARWTGGLWRDAANRPECIVPNAAAAGGGVYLERLYLRQPGPRLGNITPPAESFTVLIDGKKPSSDLALDSALYDRPGGGRYLIKDPAGIPPGATVASLNIGGIASDPQLASDVRFVDVDLDDGAGWQRANGESAWAFNWTLPAEGEYGLLSRATDYVGNVEDLGGKAPLPVRIDHGAPTTSITAPAAEPAVVRALPSNPGAETPVGPWTLPFAGTVADPIAGGLPGSGVRFVRVKLEASEQLGRSGGPVTATLGAGGAWSLDYVLPNVTATGKFVTDPAGVYTFTVLAGDQVGNQSATQHLVRVDNTAPQATLDPAFRNAADDGRRETGVGGIISQSLTLAGDALDPEAFATGFDPGGSVELALDTIDLGRTSGGVAGAKTWEAATLDFGCAGCSTTQPRWTYLLDDMIEGPYRILLRATDVAGNTSPSAAWTAWVGEIDTLAPRVGITQRLLGTGTVARTRYTCLAEDRSLTEVDPSGAAYDFCPCDDGDTVRGYDDGFGGTTGLGTRLTRLSASCEVPGHQTTPASVTAYDRFRGGSVLATVDTVAPTDPDIFVQSPSGGQVFTDLSPLTIAGFVHGPVAAPLNVDLVIGLQGGGLVNLTATPANLASQAAWSAIWTTPVEGTHVLTATAQGGGGSSVEQVLSFSVDASPPSFSLAPGGGLLLMSGGGIVDSQALPSEPAAPIARPELSAAETVGRAFLPALEQQLAQEPVASVEAPTGAGLARSAGTDGVDAMPGLVLTDTHRLAVGDGVSLRILTSDQGGVRLVEVRTSDTLGGDWVPAGLFSSSAGSSEWRYSWVFDREVDGETFAVSVRATDVAGRVTEVISTPVLVDIKLPTDPVPTLKVIDGPDEPELQPGDTITAPVPADLVLEWTASADGSGLDAYQAGYTADAVADPTLLTEVAIGAPRRVVQSTGEASRRYAHVVARDVNGNRSTVSLGPIYVDRPLTPDIVDDLDYRGFTANGCTQIGVSRDIAQQTTEADALSEPQSLYATWDDQDLRLTWLGADWNVDGDLFVYLDTRAGGSAQAFNPYSATQQVALPDKPGEAMLADRVIWVKTSTDARLMEWNGSAWVEDLAHPLTGDVFRHVPENDPPSTDLRLPLAWLGLSTGDAVGLLGLASRDDLGAIVPWASVPDRNPLADERLTVGRTRVDLDLPLALLQRFVLEPIGPDTCPNGDRFDDSDLSVDFAADPPGLELDLLADDLAQYLDPFVSGTSAPVDADLDGQIDAGIDLPNAVEPTLVGPGQIVSYTVSYQNTGPKPARDVEVVASVVDPIRGIELLGAGGSSLTLPLGDVMPGERMTTTFEGRVRPNVDSDADAVEIDLVTSDRTHGAVEWSWIQHDVDRKPPTGLDILAPRRFIDGAALQTFSGIATDPSGVTLVELEVQPVAPSPGPAFLVQCPDAEPDDGQWRCEVDLGATANESIYQIRARAFDRFGNATALGDFVPIEVQVDSEAPVLSVDPDEIERIRRIVLGSDDEISLPAVLDGSAAATDNLELDRVEVCALSLSASSCKRVNELISVNPTVARFQHRFTASGIYDYLPDTYLFYAFDAVGNRSAPVKISFRVDYVAPKIVIDSFNPFVKTSLATTILRGTIEENAIPRLTINVDAPADHPRGPKFRDLIELTNRRERDGVAIWDWFYQLPAMVPGTYVARLEAVDNSVQNLTMSSLLTIEALGDKIDFPNAPLPTGTPPPVPTPIPSATPIPTLTPTPSATPTPLPRADLVVDAVAWPSPVRAGNYMEISIDVSNLGPDATRVTLGGAIPALTEFIALVGPPDWTCTAPPGGDWSCVSDAPLAAGAMAQLRLTLAVDATAPAGSEIVTSIEASGEIGDPDPSTGSFELTTSVFQSAYSPPGDCNVDTLIDAGDLTSVVLAIFDPSYAGGQGCDANTDDRIDAADIGCTALLIFGEACTR